MKKRIGIGKRCLLGLMSLTLVVGCLYVTEPETVEAMTLGEVAENTDVADFEWHFQAFTKNKVYTNFADRTLNTEMVKITGFSDTSQVTRLIQDNHLATDEFSAGTLLSGTKKGAASIVYYNVGKAKVQKNGGMEDVTLDLKVTLVDWATPTGANASSAFVAFSTCVNQTEYNMHDQNAIGIWPSANVSWIDLKYEFFNHSSGKPESIGGYFSMVDLDYSQYFAFHDKSSGISNIHRYETDANITPDGSHHINAREGYKGSSPNAGWTTVYASKTGTDPRDSRYESGYVTFEFEGTSAMNFRFGTYAGSPLPFASGYAKRSVRNQTAAIANSPAATISHYYFGILPYSITAYGPPAPAKFVGTESSDPQKITNTSVKLNDGKKKVYFKCHVMIPRSLDKNYNSFQFEDTLDGQFDRSKSKVKIYQDETMDVTSWFSIPETYRTNGSIIAAATSDTIKEKEREFFGHSYQMVIETEVKEGAASGVTIPNTVNASTGYYSYQDRGYVLGKTGSNKVTVTYYEPALSITKRADKSSYDVGDTVTYTIAARQTTPNARAVNAYIEDNTLNPKYLTVTDARATSGAYGLEVVRTGNKVRTAETTLDNLQSIDLTITAKVIKAFDAFTNTATAAADNCSPVSATATIKASAPALKVKKTVSQPDNGVDFQIGEKPQYQVQVANTQPGTTADNIVVTDTWNAGMKLEPSTIAVYFRQGVTELDSPAAGDQLPASSYSVNQLSNGFQLTLQGGMKQMQGTGTLVIQYGTTVTARPSDNRIQNTARAVSSNAGSASDKAVVNVGLVPDVDIKKEVSRYETPLGDEIRYTVTMWNTGSLSIGNFEMTDSSLPSGFVLKSLKAESLGRVGFHEYANPMQNGDNDGIYFGSLNEKDWHVYISNNYANIGTGTGIRMTATYTTDRRVPVNTGITNTVKFTGTASNGSTVTKEASAAAMVAAPELEVTKTTDEEDYPLSGRINFTVTVQQKEDSARQDLRALDVFINDTMKRGLTMANMKDSDITVEKIGKDGRRTVLSPSSYTVCRKVSLKSGDYSLDPSAVETSGERSNQTFAIRTNQYLDYGEKLVVTYPAEYSKEDLTRGVINTAKAQAINASQVQAEASAVTMDGNFEITKTSDKQMYKPGEIATYTITITQTEDTLRTCPTVTDNFKASGLDDRKWQDYYVEGSLKVSKSDGTNYTILGPDDMYMGGYAACEMDRYSSEFRLYFLGNSAYLMQGESVTITYQMRMEEPLLYETHGPVDNTASIRYDLDGGREHVEKHADCQVEVHRPELSISKDVNGYQWKLRDHVEYTVDVTNTGAVEAKHVVVSDKDLPAPIAIDQNSIRIYDVDNEGYETPAEGVTLNKDSAGNTFSMEYPSMAPGKRLRIRYEAVVGKGVAYNTDVTNRAYASAEDVPSIMDDAVITVKGIAKVNVEITKKIKAEDLSHEYRDVAFIMTLEGTDNDGNSHSYNRLIRFTEEYAKKHTDEAGYVSVKAVFENIPAGVYTAGEEQPVSYAFQEIRDVQGGSVRGQTILFDFSDMEDGDKVSGTFINKKDLGPFFTDTAVAVNHFNVKDEDRAE